MRPEELKAKIEQLCTDHLGADTGPRVAALVRGGFTLTPVGDGESPSGRFRFGGPALLEPGTPWPTADGDPMYLLAVVDTDALAPWLDAPLPPGSGLLNVFYIGHEDRDDVEHDVETSRQVQLEAPLDWRVVPADPAAAVETAPPAEGVLLPSRPVRADPVLCLPDATRVFNPPSPEEVNDAQTWAALGRFQEYLVRTLDEGGEDDPLWKLQNLPQELMADNTNGHRAFGWPWAMQGGPTPAESRVHLLQLDTDSGWTWGDCGMISLDIPADALKAGDFSQADCYMACC